jgi:hypothetical protein
MKITIYGWSTRTSRTIDDTSVITVDHNASVRESDLEACGQFELASAFHEAGAWGGPMTQGAL